MDDPQIPSSASSSRAIVSTEQLTEIRRRLYQRQHPKPQVGRCQTCGHEHEMPSVSLPGPGLFAGDAWKCQQCGGWVTVTMTLTVNSSERTSDDDVEYLLSALATLQEAHARLTIAPDWTPTAENINALPDPVRRYIHDIETTCDPAGLQRELCIARDITRAQDVQIAAMQEELAAIGEQEAAKASDWNALHLEIAQVVKEMYEPSGPSVSHSDAVSMFLCKTLKWADRLSAFTVVTGKGKEE